MAAQIQGPKGVGANCEIIDAGTHALICMPTPYTIGTEPSLQKNKYPIDNNVRILAATAYGESSSKNIFEEIAAIANVLVRQQKARAYSSIEIFIKANKTFAFAAYDGNPRYIQFMRASDDKIKSDMGMNLALRAAINALSAHPEDYSNGAFFWDGADIKTNYDRHIKVRGGIHFTDPRHNIYNIDGKDVPSEAWWKDAKGQKIKLRGKWNYKFESTAAYGGAIFWKYSEKFLKATGNKECD